MSFTTDFSGGETLAVTKQRITAILEGWGFTPSSYTLWEHARRDMNFLRLFVGEDPINVGELGSSFRAKINLLNDPVATTDLLTDPAAALVSLFSDNRPGHAALPLPGYVFADTAGTTPATIGGQVARVSSPVAGQAPIVQSTAAARPIWGVTSEGAYYLESDGVDDAIGTTSLTSVDMTSTDHATMVAGVERTNTDAAYEYYVDFAPRTDGEMAIAHATSADSWRAETDDNSTVYQASIAAAAPDRAVLSARLQRGPNGFIQVRRNTVPSAQTSVPSTGNMVAERIRVLTRNQPADSAEGRWYGHVFCPMTPAEMTLMEYLLARLTGVTI